MVKIDNTTWLLGNKLGQVQKKCLNAVYASYEQNMSFEAKEC